MLLLLMLVHTILWVDVVVVEEEVDTPNEEKTPGKHLPTAFPFPPGTVDPPPPDVVVPTTTFTPDPAPPPPFAPPIPPPPTVEVVVLVAKKLRALSRETTVVTVPDFQSSLLLTCV